MSKIEYQNWSTEIFQGFYESELYNSDTEYSFNTNNDEDGQGYELQDWEGFTQAVAKEHADLLFDNLEQKEQIIKSIEYKGLYSPRYYNFETDKLDLIVDCDIEALKGYCFKNYKAFDLYLHDNFTSYDGFISFVPNNVKEFAEKYEDDKERLLNVMIEFYILQNLDLETYRYATVEYAQDCLYDHMKPVEQEDESCSE